MWTTEDLVLLFLSLNWENLVGIGFSPWVIKHTFSIFLQALIELLQEEPFLGCDSIIIYVTRRTEADRLAVLLRTCLPERQQITNTNKLTKDKRKNKT